MSQHPFDSGRNVISRLRWVLVGVAATVAVLGVAQMAAATNSDSTLRGCYSVFTGNLRLLAHPSMKCFTKWEHEISWNQEGAPGQQGDPGVEGLPAPMVRMVPTVPQALRAARDPKVTKGLKVTRDHPVTTAPP